jgi:hypothetical protein
MMVHWVGRRGDVLPGAKLHDCILDKPTVAAHNPPRYGGGEHCLPIFWNIYERFLNIGDRLPLASARLS